MEGSNPEKIATLLRSEPARWLCDDCISLLTHIQNRVAVNPITTALGLTSDFAREKRECDRCGTVKLVTRSVK